MFLQDAFTFQRRRSGGLVDCSWGGADVDRRKKEGVSTVLKQELWKSKYVLFLTNVELMNDDALPGWARCSAK